jgi:hypothetical protein
MTYELCRVATEDGLLLDGALAAPKSQPRDRQRAWLAIHGGGSNFTAPGILDSLGSMLTQRGDAYLRLNTRGHDLMARIPRMNDSVLGGAAYENLDEARHDLAAGCVWLMDQGFAEISLIGHSLGALKLLIAAAAGNLPGVTEIVCLSPPRLNHELLAKSDVFRADYDAAVAYVDAGRDDTLVKMREPTPITITADGALYKYGPKNHYDYLNLLPKIHLPTLVVMHGDVGASMAFHDAADLLGELSRRSTSLHVDVIPNATISYAGHESAVVSHIDHWRTRAQSELDVSI